MKDFKEIKKITIEDVKEATDCLQQLYMAVVSGRDDSLHAAMIRGQNILKKIDSYQEA